MGCDASYYEPLPCPECGKQPRYTVWYHRYNESQIHQLGCCKEVGMARRHSKEKVKEKWNIMVLKYALGERREGDA